MGFRKRQLLGHTRPSWVDEHDPLFLTFCAQPRGVNHFAHPEAWSVVLAEARFQAEKARWRPRLVLAMPDHVHVIAEVPVSPGLDRVGWCFKRGISVRLSIPWQVGFFDHRIRNADSLDEKWKYVLMNPVRGGLVKTPSDWPYVYEVK